MSSAKTIAIGSGDRTLAIISVAVSAILGGLNSAIATADSEVTIDLQPWSRVLKQYQQLSDKYLYNFLAQMNLIDIMLTTEI